MPRARRVSLVPTTPSGTHLRTSDLSVDEIEIDDEIVVKSTVFRGESDLETKLQQETPEQQIKSPKHTPRYVVRKSSDLKKIKSIDDQIEAILASPMIEKRRRPLECSRSLENGDCERTPLRVPSPHDLQAVSSRRMSAIVMSKFASFLRSSSFTEGEQHYTCPVKLNRRKTTGNFGMSSRPSELSFREPKYKTTPVTPAQIDINTEPTDLDDQENAGGSPPDESTLQRIQSVSQQLDSENVFDEPRSVNEFRVLVNLEISRLSAAKAAWEDVMEEEGASIPENALMHIRAAVGKCNLLIKKRLQTFFALIDCTEESLHRQRLGDEAELTSRQRSSINDLLGMWTNIARQISDIDKSFDRLRRWRDTAKWASSSPPITPVVSKAGNSDPVSRLSKPLKPIVWKSKGSLKRLLPPTESKLRPPKIAKRSNLARFKSQMLARKKAFEAEGSSAGVVIFGGQHVVNEELHPPALHGKSSEATNVPEPSGSLMSPSTPGSARRGRPRKSRSSASENPNQPEISEGNVDLPPPVHQASSNLVDVEPTSGKKVAVFEGVEATSEIRHLEAAEHSGVHGTSQQGDERVLVEKSVKVHSRKSGRPRESDALEFSQDLEPKVAAENVLPIQSPKRGRPRKSAVNVAEEEIAIVQSGKRRTSRKSFSIETISSSQTAVSELVEREEALQSPKRRSPRRSTVSASITPDYVIDVDADETAIVQAAKPRRPRESSLLLPYSQDQFASTEGASFRSPRGESLRKPVFDEAQMEDQSPNLGTPRSGSHRKSMQSQTQITDAGVVEMTPAVQSRKRGRPRKSTSPALAKLVATPQSSFSSVVNSAPQDGNEPSTPITDTSVVARTPVQSRKRGIPPRSSTSTPRRGRPPKVSIFSRTDLVNVSENAASRTSDGNFLIPDSLPRKRPRMDHSLLSNSQASEISSTPNPFSPPPRPATGTPRPHMSQLMRTKVNSSLSQSVLRKQLMLATACGGNSSGRSSAAAPSRPNSGKSLAGRPRKSVRFMASPGSSLDSKVSLPVTPHVKSSTDPNRRVSQRVRQQRNSP